MTIGIVVFPGSNCDRDVGWALEGCLGRPVRFLWHEERDLSGIEAVVLPGGFSYGDYLRCGAIARFAPVLEEVRAFAERGGPVLGICNGFQVLTEMGLLPGVLTRNRNLHFICDEAQLEVRPGNVPLAAGLRGRGGDHSSDRPWRRPLPGIGGGLGGIGGSGLCGVALPAKPEWVHGRCGRPQQCPGERAGSDAPPGTGLRSSNRRQRWPPIAERLIREQPLIGASVDGREEILALDGIRIHGFFTGCPVGRADLIGIRLHILEGLQHPQGFIHTSAHRQVVDGAVHDHTLRIDDEQIPAGPHRPPHRARCRQKRFPSSDPPPGDS